MTWYDNEGKEFHPTPKAPPRSSLFVARVLPDGATQFRRSRGTASACDEEKSTYSQGQRHS